MKFKSLFLSLLFIPSLAMASPTFKIIVKNKSMQEAFSHPAPKYSSCDDILKKGASKGDGDYTIYPTTSSSGISVYCDMTTNGGGWTQLPDINYYVNTNGSQYTEDLVNINDYNLKYSQLMIIDNSSNPSSTNIYNPDTSWLESGIESYETFIKTASSYYEMSNIVNTTLSSQPNLIPCKENNVSYDRCYSKIVLNVSSPVISILNRETETYLTGGTNYLNYNTINWHFHLFVR